MAPPHKYLASLALLGLSSFAAACDMEEVDPYPADSSGIRGLDDNWYATDPALCKTQGEDSYTWAMVISESTLGVNSPSGGDSSLVQGAYFIIMDNNCYVKGMYNKPECRPMWTIKDSFLPYTLDIRSIFMDTGDPDFAFTYANGLYEENVDGCGCKNLESSEFLSVAVGCKCAFPINGEPDKKPHSIGGRVEIV